MYYRTITLYITLLLAQPLFAQETTPKTCVERFNAITAQQNNMRSCWVDTDCVAVNFGCPWQQAGCDSTILSLESPDTLSTLVESMADYQQHCVDTEPQFKARCDAQNSTQQQQACPTPTLKCLNGECVTKTHVLLQHESR